MPRPMLILTDEQRRESLEKARAARAARSELLTEIRSGAVTLDDLLARIAEPVVGALPVRTLLIALPGVGTTGADNFLAEAGISDRRRLRGLGSRQRQALSDWREQMPWGR
jgi:transposase